MFLLSMNMYYFALASMENRLISHRFSGFSLFSHVTQHRTVLAVLVVSRNHSETIHGWYIFLHENHKQISQMWENIPKNMDATGFTWIYYSI